LPGFGAARAGRDPAKIDRIIPLIVAVGNTPEERALPITEAKTTIASYAPCRTMRPHVEGDHGLGGVRGDGALGQVMPIRPLVCRSAFLEVLLNMSFRRAELNFCATWYAKIHALDLLKNHLTYRPV